MADAASFPQPALLGGPAVRPHGPPEWPTPDSAVLHALQEAYRDGSWGKYHGPHVPLLEQRLADYHGVACALTCASGTFAVELALRALKIGADDEVILAAYEYGGNFLSVHAVGARPVLVDIDPDNWNLAPERIAAAVSPATKAVLVSHLHGGLVPMSRVVAVAAACGLAVVEDAAQAPGAVVEGRKAGAWGDVGVLSFGGSKLLTAGRGGALLTNRADLHQRARLLLHRGNHVCPLSELQAAVLLPQLTQLDERTALRAHGVAALATLLADVPGLRFFRNAVADATAAFYKVGVQFDAEQFGLPREIFVRALRAEGIAFDDGFHALHVGRSPTRFRSAGALTEAERAHRACLVLHHPCLLHGASAVAEVALAVLKTHAHAPLLREEAVRRT
jgi:dTDP-4-amino-4,6-dideoxygalactose transaminase